MTNEYIVVKLRHADVSFTIVAGYLPPAVNYDCYHLDSILQQSRHPMWYLETFMPAIHSGVVGKILYMAERLSTWLLVMTLWI